MERIASGSAAVSPIAFSVLTALLEARTGQQLASYRSWRVDMALKPIIRDRGLETLDQLVAQLLDGNDASVGDLIVDALVNQETSFFRDGPIFDQAIEVLTACGRRRPRVWSAGCSTGQEPLSLAMILAERTAAGLPPVDIIATDVSEAAIQRAKSGKYTQFEVQRGLPIRQLMTWFDGGDASEWLAKPELVRMVQWRRHNLVAEPALTGGFDLILCRNVMMYLSPATRVAVYAGLAKALNPGGVLVLGAGETVIGLSDALEPSRRWRGFYERVA
jgi:chemotaxis protein methyltransferase CheR